MVENLEVEIWREVGRHASVAEAVPHVARLLRKILPLSALWVRRCSPEQRTLGTVATDGPAAGETTSTAVTSCSAAQWRRLQAWAKATRSVAAVPPRSVEGRLLVPGEPDGDRLAGPLMSGGNLVGVLVLVAPPGKRFRAEHRRIAAGLLEPFATALATDHRLHELTSLREAAEADRESLLARLGKRELSETVVGADGGLRLVMERVDLVARSDAPVLLLGETGSGKEVVARALHLRSPRRLGPFIRVNCGAIPGELIDSQLFGHEKGSFTGAADLRQGWFERADGGTLFLDEIGELPLAAQVRLLRVLQDGYLERVGGQQPVRVDVRIVAATHRDLAAMVERKEFREDLWYRLAVFPILIPPLRERRGDIPELARHFAARAALRFGLAPVVPTDHDLELLANYRWPGNVRELAAVIDRAAILGEGRTLAIATALGVTDSSPAHGLSQPHVVDLSAPDKCATEPRATNSTAPDSIIATASAASPHAPGSSAVISSTSAQRAPASDSIASLDDAIRAHIIRALELTRGQIEGSRGAAALLKINPHTLRAKMRKLGIEWDKYRP